MGSSQMISEESLRTPPHSLINRGDSGAGALKKEQTQHCQSQTESRV